VNLCRALAHSGAGQGGTGGRGENLGLVAAIGPRGEITASAAPNQGFPGIHVNPVRSPFLPMLGFLAGFVLVFGVGLMLALGGGRAHLPGRLTIAIGALVLIGWLDGQATLMMNRRRPLLAPDPPSYRRFVVWSALGFFASAAILLGLAWWLP
jgi:hypothetical protein